MILREVRIDKKMTQEDVAKLSGIDRTNLSRIERGIQKPKFSTAEKLASVYDLSVGDIFNMCSNAS